MDRETLSQVLKVLRIIPDRQKDEAGFTLISDSAHGPIRVIADLLNGFNPAANIPEPALENFIEGNAAILDWVRTDGCIPNDALMYPIPIEESSFPFVDDEELRDMLDRDLQDAELCFAERLWKPCMVLCGGILEALLYEYLLRDSAWTMAQKGVPQHKGKPREITKGDLENQWTLEQLIALGPPPK
mgnify:CR=1 FL=1